MDVKSMGVDDMRRDETCYTGLKKGNLLGLKRGK